MSEWSVFGVIVAIISAFFLVYTPLRNSAKERETRALEREKEKLEQERIAAATREANTKAVTELTTSLRIFTEHFAAVEKSNHESHQQIYNRLDEKGKMITRHDERLSDHERRISFLEKGE